MLHIANLTANFAVMKSELAATNFQASLGAARQRNEALELEQSPLPPALNDSTPGGGFTASASDSSPHGRTDALLFTPRPTSLRSRRRSVILEHAMPKLPPASDRLDGRDEHIWIGEEDAEPLMLYDAPLANAAASHSRERAPRVFKGLFNGKVVAVKVADDDNETAARELAIVRATRVFPFSLHLS